MQVRLFFTLGRTDALPIIKSAAAWLVFGLLCGGFAFQETHAQTTQKPPRENTPAASLQLERHVVITTADEAGNVTRPRDNGKTLTVDLTSAAPGVTRFAIVSATRNGAASYVPANLSVTAQGELRWQDIAPGYYGNWNVRLRASNNTGRAREIVLPVDIRLPPGTPPPCETATRYWCEFVRERWAQEQAAGNLGDFYNNRDNGHGNYQAAAQSRQIRLLTGGSAALLVPWPSRNVAGNASVFYQGPLAASMDRFHSFTQAEFNAKVRVYEANHVFWYPAHTDIFGNGDLFHYNAAYSNTVVGSSGSELDEVGNTFIAWAALRPDVKTRLAERGLLAPVTQMLLRRNRVGTDAEYLTGAAHASGVPVSAGAAASLGALAEQRQLELARAANKITVQTIPPLAKLRVVREDFMAEDREQLATTAWGVHRIWRREEVRREIVLSAEDSFDLNRRPLRFHWAVLRGNAWVTIEPVDAQARQVRIVLNYPQRYQFEPVPPGGQTNWTTRLDVGLFAHNGTWYSPPAIFTVYALDAETRFYDVEGRLTGAKPSGRADHPRLK